MLARIFTSLCVLYSQADDHPSEAVPESATPNQAGQLDATRLGIQRALNALAELGWHSAIGIIPNPYLREEDGRGYEQVTYE